MSDDIRLTNRPTASSALLIRKPVDEVFNAFIDPEITKNFWFTHSSGRLEAGKQIEWRWEMYDMSLTIDVKSIERGKQIVIEWPDPHGGKSVVSWSFTPHDPGTFVQIENFGFSGSGDEQLATAIDSTQGFTFVLAGLKAYLEHGIRLNIVADVHPDGVDGCSRKN